MKDNIHIRKATSDDANLLSLLANKTFIESHGHSASEEGIKNYLNENLSLQNFQNELSNPNNIYYICSIENQAVGFSKIIFNRDNLHTNLNPITCLERIYVLESHHGKGIGLSLWKNILAISKDGQQKGIWLNVWIENHKAIAFYRKLGFEIIGKYDFQISASHSNPNHQMLLKL